MDYNLTSDCGRHDICNVKVIRLGLWAFVVIDLAEGRSLRYKEKSGKLYREIGKNQYLHLYKDFSILSKIKSLKFA